MKPLANEGDVLVLIDGDHDYKYYMVQRVEDFVYDYSFSSATTAGSLSSFTEIDNTEPDDEDDPVRQIYQLRVGVDVGKIYTEMLAGTIRRTPYKQRRPTSSAPYVGYFDEVSSPYYDPQYEFFLRYNEKPGFAVYNQWGFSITPRLAFRGRKLRVVDMQMNGAAQLMDMDAGTMSQMLADVKAHRRTARRITMLGMDR